MRFFIRPLLVSAFALGLAAQASATVFLPADFADVVTGSGTIVFGRVVEVRSRLSGPDRTIDSVVTLSVIESLKGEPGATVSFRVPNGQVGRYRRILVGAPEFAEGDEVVAFLRGRPPGMPVLFGLSQGVYHVVRDASGGPLVAPPVIGRGVGVERVVRGDPARRPLPLDAFARAVRAVEARAR